MTIQRTNTNMPRPDAKYSESDLEFLSAVGISTEPTRDDTILALARRIAKHKAPGQPVKVDPEEAKLQLIRFAAARLLAAENE